LKMHTKRYVLPLGQELSSILLQHLLIH